MRKLLEFVVNYNLQIAVIAIISYLLFASGKTQTFYYFDTDFIKTKFALKLAEKKRLTEKDILSEFAEFEKSVRVMASEMVEGNVLLKKGAVISGGIDITRQICERLDFSNCDVYE